MLTQKEQHITSRNSLKVHRCLKRKRLGQATYEIVASAIRFDRSAIPTPVETVQEQAPVETAE